MTTPYSNYSPKQTTKNAATTVINDLLSWLKETLLRGAKYIPVKSGKWLKAKAGEYSWADPSQVPRKAKQEYGQLNEENHDSDSDHSQSTSGESATWDVDSETRKTRLKKANSLQAARLLSDNSRMLATAKAEPSVVDCDTAVGVELKAAAYSGNLDSVTGKYDVSPEQVGDIIGTELAARAGYNTFGDSLPGEIGNAEADAEGEGDAGDAGGNGGDGLGKGNGANPQSGRPSPGTDTSHIPTKGSSNSSSGSGGRPSPGSKGSHIPTASSGSNAGDTGSSSGSGGSGSAGAAGNSGGAGTGSGGSGSGSAGTGD